MTGDDTRGWEAVGRLNIAGKAFCTGSLVSETIVLTAAHCLFDAESGAAFDPTSIEFLAGWRDGRAAAYRGVRRAAIHPDYDFDGPDKASRSAPRQSFPSPRQAGPRRATRWAW
jgi:secreted trypsin-like serine protease